MNNDYDVIVSFLKIDERATIPKYAHDGDACMDLSVVIDDKDMKPFVLSGDVQSSENNVPVAVHVMGDLPYVNIEPGQALVFHTGLKCSTSAGYAMKVHVRSSVGIKKKLRLSNCTGIIDTAQYRGELLISLHNDSSKTQKVFHKDRVAQAEIVPVLKVVVEEVTSLSDTERGTGGVGSTGR